MHPSPEAAARMARLAAHAASCEECAAAPLPLDRIAMLLNAAEVGLDPQGASARAMAPLRRELRMRSPFAWRAVALGLLRALVPLPAVLAVDVYLLWILYSVGETMLPGALVAYVVCSYAALLLLLFALTYAAVPLLMMWQSTPHRELARPR